MKTHQFIGVFTAALLILAGCSDQKVQARKAQEDTEAKARAQAAKKEMDALPKAFQTPDYFKKNEPTKQPTSTSKPPQNVKR
jgi:protein involved in sex pheromone biosynthesis